ncbi:hypothetical protein KA525_03250, partial [Candidatus Woesebacteria bacterium]|nr:hypothetical protein [Candidatus Woesebacteria bacterium]
MRPIFLITVTLLFSHQFIAACKKNKLEPDGVKQLFGRLQSNGSSKSKETPPPPDNYSDLPLKLESGTMSTLNWSTAAQCKNPGSVYG